VKKWTGGGKAGRGWLALGRATLCILVGLFLLAGCFGLGFPAEASGAQTRGARLEFFREGEPYDFPGYGEEYWVFSAETTSATPERQIRYLNLGGEPQELGVGSDVEVRLCWEEQTCTRFLFWKSCSWEEKQQTLLFPRVPHSSSEDREFGPRQADSRPSSDDDVYIVQDGDTLWDIAVRYNLDVWALARINGLEHPYIIHPRDVIKLY